MGWSKCKVPSRWSCQDLHLAVEFWSQSLQWLALLLFTDYLRIVVLRHANPLFEGIPPQYWQWQSQNKLLSWQFAYHIRFQVNILQSSISSATRTLGIFESQTHLLPINHIAQTWCARNGLWASFKWNTRCQGIGQHASGKMYIHSASLLPHLDPQVLICCWLRSVQNSIINRFY